jgi:glyoxylase-like metal-dependent hydrolase (beta-lactamase superfamily II)
MSDSQSSGLVALATAQPNLRHGTTSIICSTKVDLDYDTLMHSITKVLFVLGDAAAIVHPGHGPDTTIGRERTTNPFVLEYLEGR